MKYITYRGGYKYQLQQDRHYVVEIDLLQEKHIQTDYVDLTPEGKLIIKNGYAWDGPSGPTFDTPCFMRGSLIHDALYQLMRLEELDRKAYRGKADQILRDVCRDDGMSRFGAWCVYWGVRLFADPSADPGREKQPVVAPKIDPAFMASPEATE